MAKMLANHGKDWTPADLKQLWQEVKQNTPTRVLGLHLGRTAAAVHMIWPGCSIDSVPHRTLCFVSPHDSNNNACADL